MMMPKSLAAIAVIAALALFVSCSRDKGGAAEKARVFNSLADFSGKRIASESGTVFAKFIDLVIPNVKHRYYVSFDEVMTELQTGAIDAIALDMPVALFFAAHNRRLAVFPYVISVDNYGFAVPKGSPLCEDGNNALQKLKDGGVIDEAEMYWFAVDAGKNKDMPQLDHRHDFNGAAGTIKFGCENTLFPMSYVGADGKPAGFDIDIINRIAYELNMRVEVVTMPFRELFPALLSGRLDMVGGSVTMTDERSKIMDFIGPYFEGGTALVVRESEMPRN